MDETNGHWALKYRAMESSPRTEASSSSTATQQLQFIGNAPQPNQFFAQVNPVITQPVHPFTSSNNVPHPAPQPIHQEHLNYEHQFCPTNQSDLAHEGMSNHHFNGHDQH